MTKQEYYDRLKAAATDGTFPAVNPAVKDRGVKNCYYRVDLTPSCPQRCAAGLLIPDEKYTPDLEGGLFEPKMRAVIELPDGMTLDDVCWVQTVHDTTARSPQWSPEAFISYINKLPCFADVQK